MIYVLASRTHFHHTHTSHVHDAFVGCILCHFLPHAPRNRHVPLLLCLSRAQATCLLLLLATKRRDARRESTMLLPVCAWVLIEWVGTVRKGGACVKWRVSVAC